MLLRCSTAVNALEYMSVTNVRFALWCSLRWLARFNLVNVVEMKDGDFPGWFHLIQLVQSNRHRVGNTLEGKKKKTVPAGVNDLRNARPLHLFVARHTAAVQWLDSWVMTTSRVCVPLRFTKFYLHPLGRGEDDVAASTGVGQEQYTVFRSRGMATATRSFRGRQMASKRIKFVVVRKILSNLRHSQSSLVTAYILIMGTQPGIRDFRAQLSKSHQ